MFFLKWYRIATRAGTIGVLDSYLHFLQVIIIPNCGIE